jgi:hypothetical protein
MVFNQNEGLPEPFTNSNVYMTVIKEDALDRAKQQEVMICFPHIVENSLSDQDGCQKPAHGYFGIDCCKGSSAEELKKNLIRD